MNPIVATLASKVGFDAASYTWFDFTDIDDSANEELTRVAKEHGWDQIKFGLSEFYTPSDHMAVIAPGFPEMVFTYDKFAKIGGYEGAAVMLSGENNAHNVPLAIMTERHLEVGPNEKNFSGTGSNLIVQKAVLKHMQEKQMDHEKTMKMFEDACISAVNYACLMNLRAHTTEQVLIAHVAKGMDFINRKRRAKNEPCLYTWNTIELKPQAQVKQPSKGGTHASPARHKRRAHMRRLRNGGFTWIPEMWVGKIENGLIVHDYVADRELTTKGDGK